MKTKQVEKGKRRNKIICIFNSQDSTNIVEIRKRTAKFRNVDEVSDSFDLEFFQRISVHYSDLCLCLSSSSVCFIQLDELYPMVYLDL